VTEPRSARAADCNESITPLDNTLQRQRLQG